MPTCPPFCGGRPPDASLLATLAQDPLALGLTALALAVIAGFALYRKFHPAR